MVRATREVRLSLPLPAVTAVTEWLALWPWAEGAVILFGFAWGAMLGSFINVVVHRLPLGESVVRERSRGPNCRSAIQARDNLPVVGWLLLRGRCRACGNAISPVYPLVEATSGLLVATLAAAELAGGGRWLFHGSTGYPLGVDRLLRGDWQLLVTCCLHAGVVLFVLTWALLDRAGWTCPATWLAFPLGLSLLAAGMMPLAAPPGLMPDGGGWPGAGLRFQGLMASLAGAAVGGFLGLTGPAASGRLGLPLLGAVLGWQTLLVVTIVTALATEIAGRCVPGNRRRGDFGLGLTVSAAFALACQAPLVAVWQGVGKALFASPING